MPIVIIEGGELVGKTSIVRALQDKIPYYTLLKLSGLPTSEVSDMEARGKMMAEQYEAVIPMLSMFAPHAGNIQRTLLLDRFATTEKVMFRTAFNYGLLHKVEAYAVACRAKQIILTAPADVLKARFDERRKVSSLESQTFGAILDVHRRYIEESASAHIDTVVVSNDGSYTVDEIADHIIRLFDIPVYQIND